MKDYKKGISHHVGVAVFLFNSLKHLVGNLRFVYFPLFSRKLGTFAKFSGSMRKSYRLELSTV